MLLSIRSALLTYIAKFKSRFTGANASYLKQLALVLKGLSEFIAEWVKEGTFERGKKEELVDVNKVLGGKSGGALDQINLLKLDTYLKSSRIARKVRSLSRVSVRCMLTLCADRRLRRQPGGRADCER